MPHQIRLATAQDAAALAEIYGPIVASTPISFEIEPPDAAEMARRITETLVAYPWLVCQVLDRIAGYAYAARHRTRAAYQWSVDVSVYVHPGFRRRGIGRGLYTSLFEILAAQSYVNAYAGIALPNPGSVGLHESVGFQKVGVYRQVGFKLGIWHDVGWWQRALRPPGEHPVAPRMLADAQRDPSWQRMLATGLPLIRNGE